MGKPSQQLTKAVRDYLTAQGWFVWKGGGGAMRVGTRFIRWGTNGAPDLFAIKQRLAKPLDYNDEIDKGQEYTCIYISVLLGLEIKAGKDIQSNAQKAFQEDFEVHGGTYIIVRKTEDLDEYV